MEARIVELEIRYSHQQRTLEELSDVVAAQERRIDQLTKELMSLRARIAELSDESPPNERPPHY